MSPDDFVVVDPAHMKDSKTSMNSQRADRHTTVDPDTKAHTITRRFTAAPVFTADTELHGAETHTRDISKEEASRSSDSSEGEGAGGGISDAPSRGPSSDKGSEVRG